MGKKSKPAKAKVKTIKEGAQTADNKNDQTIIVAIGASAGGLNALERFFKNASPTEGVAYVVIQHLDPSHKSMLPDILQRFTSMEVKQVQNNMEVEPDKVYVIPPGYDLTINKGSLFLKKQEKPRGIRLPIDLFFRSLKDEMHENAIGIILSGTGSDGTLGLREIKAENGMMMVQDPDTADHKGMPQNAIETGLVDFILAPEDMPEKLLEFVHETLKKPSKQQNYNQSEIEKHTTQVFRILRSHTKHDFSDYKQSTVFRRIERRMAVNTVPNLEAYIEHLKNTPNEIDSLFNEFLIGVTSFFRDKEAFNSLETQVFPKISKKESNDPIRIWVTGCSTGEEAYSIAILLRKYLTANNNNLQVQIFASDIDDKSLDTARLGKYPLNIEADVPSEYLSSYFHKRDSFYQVKKDIREMVVFANQSIVKDPPYSRIDLISCRNLLIYLKGEMQKRIIDIFHYALKENSYLFLGNSESLGARKDSFKALDTKWKIFQKKENNIANRGLWAFSGKNYSYSGNKKDIQKTVPKISVKEFAENQVHDKYMYPFLVIDKEGEIQYSLGNLKNYFQYPKGEPNYNILSIAVESLRVPLANAIRKIKVKKEKLVYDNLRFTNDDEVELIKLSIIPVTKPAAFGNLFIVLIEPSKSFAYQYPDDDSANENIHDQDEYIQTLERELHETRDYLQSVIEELETSNEELKSANEEAQSSNEELQSTNEELETSKEELQSLNEELETSNHELQRKVTEVTQVNNDINNFITSTQIGVVFLDKEMKIQRFTPSMRKIIELLDSDVGRPLSNFVTNLDHDNLIEDNREVLETLVPKKAQVSVKNGGHYWMRILPYRTMDDNINGTVITFTEITELKRAQNEALKSKERFKLLFEKLRSGIIVIEIIYDKNKKAVDGKIVDVNDAYWEHTGIARRTVIGKTINEVFPNYRKDLFQKLVKVAENEETYNAVEYVPQFDKHLHIAAYSFQPNQYIAIFDDITSQIKAQEALIESEEKFRGLFKSLNSGLIINNVLRKRGEKPEFIVEMVNPAFEKITRIPGKKVVSKHLFSVLTENEIEIENWLHSTEKEKIAELEYFWKSKKKHLRLTSFPIQKKQRILIIQDVTRERNEFISRNHLASIVESSEDAIYSISTNGTIISWNKGAESFYGYKSEEIIGKNISMLNCSEVDNEVHMQLIENVIKGETVKNHELVQKNKKGIEIPVSLTKSPIFNEKGKVVAISDVVKDMTKIKEREIELIEARQKSEQASLLKTTFLQNISHEIRTPMNSIIGFTDLLKNKLDEKNSKYLRAIDESGQQLMRLIDDILDLSRLESGELSVEKKYFNLNELLEYIKIQFTNWKKTKNKKDLKLSLEIPKTEKPTYLYTDRDRLKQIINNLLSNAIKYTKQGHIKFGYKTNKKAVVFFVEDTGKGIPQKHLDKIFDRFERAGIESDDVFSGTGLGLAISKGLTEVLGGQIRCESEVGKGSTFYLSVPNDILHKPVEEIKPKQNQSTAPPNLSGKIILVAEDDDFSVQMLQMMLVLTKADIMFASDGEEAINIFKQHKVDMALLDIRLPKKDGFEIATEIRKFNKNIPIVAQSAYALPDDKKKMLENGFNDNIEKPLTTAKLYNLLAKYLTPDEDGKEPE